MGLLSIFLPGDVLPKAERCRLLKQHVDLAASASRAPSPGIDHFAPIARVQQAFRRSVREDLSDPFLTAAGQSSVQGDVQGDSMDGLISSLYEGLFTDLLKAGSPTEMLSSNEVTTSLSLLCDTAVNSPHAAAPSPDMFDMLNLGVWPLPASDVGTESLSWEALLQF